MNRHFRHTSILLSIIYFCFISLNNYAQSNELIFENSPLSEVIISLDNNSNYVFNYDPILLEGFSFTGRIDKPFDTVSLKNILVDSPLSYEVDEQDILIYLPEPVTYRICGTIQDGLSNEPMMGANIIGVNSLIGDQSNEAGFFDLNIAAHKNEKISISYLGYESKEISMQEIKVDDCGIYLMSIDRALWDEEIVIKDYLLTGISAGNAYNGFEMDFNVLSKYHTNVEHDVLKTTQFLPGIMSIDDSASNLQIRGSTPDQNLILWEGAPLYNAGHLFGMISAINPFAVDAVNVYKGSHDPKYDNRVGGIIDISLQDSILRSAHGSIGSTLTEGHVNIDLPIIKNKLSFELAGRHSINAIYDSPPLQSYTNKVFQFTLIDDQSEDALKGIINTDQQLQYADWNTKLLYKPSEQFSFKASMYNNSQDFLYEYSFPDDPFLSSTNITVDTRAINTQVSWKPNNRWTTELSYLQSRYENLHDQADMEEDILQVDFYQYNDILDQSYTLSSQYVYTPYLSFSGGYTYNFKEVELDIIDDSIFKPFFEERRIEAGSFHNIYASSHYSKRSFSTDLGMRTTYYQENDQLVFSPRYTAQLALGKTLKLKSEGGIFHQFISQLSQYERSIRIDNPIWTINSIESQLSQRATKLAAGLVYQDKGWLLDIEVYKNHTSGLSTLAPSFITPQNDEFARGSANATGLNVLLKKRWVRFHTWVNYSLGSILYSFPDINAEEFYAPNDVRHSLSVESSYSIKDLQLSLHTNYRTGTPFSKPIGVFDYVDDRDNMSYFLVDYVETNNERLIDYLRTDVNLHYRPTLKRFNNVRAEISFSLLNIFNRENIFASEDFLEYDEEETIPSLVNIQKSLLARTPLLMCRLYW